MSRDVAKARDDYFGLRVLVHNYDTIDPDEFDRLLDEVDALRAWQSEACEELADIRSQWGHEYLWEKHNERFVVDLLERAGHAPV